ncbi:MAG: four helix bundle protein [Rhodothermales bacterium]
MDERKRFEVGQPVSRFEELRVYKGAFELAARIFESSAAWPKEERYALTDQVRRSSRSVCANIAEAWCKRRYPKHFVSKLSDAHGEAAVWLNFARRCGYVDEATAQELRQACRHIIGGLIKMMAAPEKWCGPANLIREDEADYDAF